MDCEQLPPAHLIKLIRIADQSCSCHAYLRDKYKRLSLMTDSIALIISTWILTTIFIQPGISLQLTPRFITPTIWIGILSFCALMLTTIQLVVDWKGKCHAHQHAATSLSSFVKEFRQFTTNIDEYFLQKALLQYRLITDGLEPIPEKLFLKLKRKHLMKIAISRHLDTNPGTSILFFRLKLWLRDNGLYPSK